MERFQPPGVAGAMLVTKFWREFALAVLSHGGNIEDLEELGRREGISTIDEMARVFVKGHAFKVTPEYLSVPYQSHTEFWQAVRREGLFTWVDGELEAWDCQADAPGVDVGANEATFQVVKHCFGKTVELEQVRYYERAYGLMGDAQLFLAWAKHNLPEGEYASIPADEQLWSRSALRCAPYFSNHRQQQRLGLRDVSKPFGSYLTFIFFKRVLMA